MTSGAHSMQHCSTRRMRSAAMTMETTCSWLTDYQSAPSKLYRMRRVPTLPTKNRRFGRAEVTCTAPLWGGHEDMNNNVFSTPCAAQYTHDRSTVHSNELVNYRCSNIDSWFGRRRKREISDSSISTDDEKNIFYICSIDNYIVFVLYLNCALVCVATDSAPKHNTLLWSKKKKNAEIERCE